MKKVALITGVTGQDGSILTDFLLKKNYKIIGVQRRSSSFNTKRIDHIYDNPKFKKIFQVVYGDLTDSSNITRIIQKYKPDEIYNLAAQSHVLTSFEIPEYTSNVDALGTLRILESIRLLGLEKKQNSIKLRPQKYLEILKSHKMKKLHLDQQVLMLFQNFIYWMTINYREAYKIFAVNGILFNHEGTRRGETFVTKITQAVSRIYKNKERKYFS